MPRRLQSILALVAGFVWVVVSVLGTDATARLPEPHDLVTFVVMLWSMLVGVTFGSYITAYLAPRRPLRHALELGLLVLLVTAVMYCFDAPFGTHAASKIVTLFTILPAAWLGGTLARVFNSLSA